MMKDRSDQDMKSALEGLVPPVSSSGKWPRVQARLKKGRTGRVLQAVAIPVTLLLIVAIGYWTITALYSGEMVVVDDAPSGDVTGSTAESPVDADATSASREEEVLEIVKELRSSIEAGDVVVPWPLPASYPGTPQTPGSYRTADEALQAAEDALLSLRWVHLMLKLDATEADLEDLTENVSSNEGVLEVQFTSSEEARESWKENPPERYNPSAEPPSAFLRPTLSVKLEPGATLDQSELYNHPAVEQISESSSEVLPGEFAAGGLGKMLDATEAETPEAAAWLESAKETVARIVEESGDTEVTAPEPPEPDALIPLESADLSSISLEEVWTAVVEKMMGRGGESLTGYIQFMQIEDRGTTGWPDRLAADVHLPPTEEHPDGVSVWFNLVSDTIRAEWEPLGEQRASGRALIPLDAFFQTLDEIGVGRGEEILGMEPTGEDFITWMIEAVGGQPHRPANGKTVVFDGSSLKDIRYEEFRQYGSNFVSVDVQYMKQESPTTWSGTETPRVVILVPLTAMTSP